MRYAVFNIYVLVLLQYTRLIISQLKDLSFIVTCLWTNKKYIWFLFCFLLSFCNTNVKLKENCGPKITKWTESWWNWIIASLAFIHEHCKTTMRATHGENLEQGNLPRSRTGPKWPQHDWSLESKRKRNSEDRWDKRRTFWKVCIPIYLTQN